MPSISDIKKENAELKEALAILLNQGLIKKLSEALERIDNGEYLAEEEFFSGSHQEDA